MLFLNTAWSAPGRLMEATVRRITTDHGLALVHLDLDGDPGLIRRYGLKTVPALILVEGDRIVRSWMGFRAADEIRAGLDEADRASVRS